MKILFTGASSFTGYWFARALADSDHEVVCTLLRGENDYEGIRARRVEALKGNCTLVFNCAFGSPQFLQQVSGSRHWDMLCHHGAEVGDYKSQDFDVAAALASNTNNLNTVLQALADRGAQRVVLTGSVFEENEGAGSDGLPTFSPYGISKSATASVFRYQADRLGLGLGKFVIPNPFGAFEEPRFTAYLLNTWARGEAAAVNTPDYIRDNIHVDLLAAVYAQFVENLAEVGYSQVNPSGYVESQGQFAQRFAAAMRPRLSAACEVVLNNQTDFSEPFFRTNTESAERMIGAWDEEAAWDSIADFYGSKFKGAPAASEV